MISTLHKTIDWSLFCDSRRLVRRIRTAGRVAVSSGIHPIQPEIALLLIVFIIPLGIADVYAQDQQVQEDGYRQLSYEQLDQLVAPIALYPDALIAQVMTAATFSGQVVEADRLVQNHAGAPPQEIARMADSQPWDPSVKALVAFPSVLSNMDRNINWATKLGNAYYNQPEDVMGAVQSMRQRAYVAGTLRTTPQEIVAYQPASIVIQPADPAAVYVPTYNPWVVYGAPLPVYPAYYIAPVPVRPAGTVVGAAAIGFTVGVVVGAFASYGWGWGHWGCGWGPHPVVAFNRVTYVSRSVTVINHGYYGGFDHSVEARSWNQNVAYGPHGGTYTDTRSLNNGVYNNSHNYAGPHGSSYTDTRTASDGAYSNTRTAVGSHGGSYTDQRTAGNGEINNTRTVTGPNGKTASTATSQYAGGSTKTMTGPNGNTATRTVTGRGAGDATVTRAGPHGTRTHTRSGH
jgi:hypothetical protein